MRRLAIRALVLLFLAALLAECVLQLGSLFMRGREHAPEGGRVILCIGDSHTYGAPLPEPESYPAQLQRLLDARSPGEWAVVNAGIPGTNTSQWRERLPALLDKYRPERVVIWMGVNDLWNSAGTDAQAETWGERLAAVAARSRLYRLAMVWQHDRAIDMAALERGGRLESSVQHPHKGALWTVKHADGHVEQVKNVPIPTADWNGERTTNRAAADFAAMVRILRARGIEPVLISYPLENNFFSPANRAIRQVAAEQGVPLVDGTTAALRVPAPERVYLWADHPSAPIYAEVARDVAALVR